MHRAAVKAAGELPAAERTVGALVVPAVLAVVVVLPLTEDLGAQRRASAHVLRGVAHRRHPPAAGRRLAGDAVIAGRADAQPLDDVEHQAAAVHLVGHLGADLVADFLERLAALERAVHVERELVLFAVEPTTVDVVVQRGAAGQVQVAREADAAVRLGDGGRRPVHGLRQVQEGADGADVHQLGEEAEGLLHLASAQLERVVEPVLTERVVELRLGLAVEPELDLRREADAVAQVAGEIHAGRAVRGATLPLAAQVEVLVVRGAGVPRAEAVDLDVLRDLLSAGGGGRDGHGDERE